MRSEEAEQSARMHMIMWATSWENLFMPYANNKGADPPAIRAVWSAPLLYLYSLISIIAKSKISIF